MKFSNKYFSFCFLFAIILLTPAAVQAQGSETGMGTYYADKYHGRPTASGELYDKFKFTAAHKTLPFGTMVRVTRLDNGRSVVVKVNDRGPFTPGRVIDVSRTAAEQLDLIRTGETRVRVEIVQGGTAGQTSGGATTSAPATSGIPQPTTNFDPSNRDLSGLPLRNFGGQEVSSSGQPAGTPVAGVAQAESAQPGSKAMNGAAQYTPAFFQYVAFKRDVDGFAIQVGAFFNFYRLMEAMDQLSAKGIQNTILHSSLKDGEPIFRILIGPYANREEAKTVLRTLTSQGVEGIVVKTSDLK